MKKGVVILIAFLLILSSGLIVIAQEDEKVDKAYECLEDKVDDKCEDLSIEEQAFTTLAIGECSSELKDNSRFDECWPEAGCRLRDTSLALLAYDRVGRSTTEIEDWLLDQKKTPTDLRWFLEIDSDEETTCEISYGSTERSIVIGEDKKINRGAGTCLSLARDSYWLEIADSCYETNFTISCDKDFLTTLLYEKKTGQTIFVSSQTESAPAEGSTEHRVNAFCFRQGNSCNYEGSLWATLALAKAGNDISSFLPYLIAMEEGNEKYFPSAFLHIITDYDEYFTKVIGEQKDDYWKIKDSPYHQFYDTALGLLSLYGLDAEQAGNAKSYLLEVQDDNGCWRNNIRDTAFILYSAWPKSVSAAGGDTDDCETYDYFCTSPLDCAQNDVLDNYVCYGGKVCCETEPAEQTCDEKGGIECTDDQECTGAVVSSSDVANCCKGSCITKTEEPECEKENFICRYSCFDDEDQKLFDCDGEKICCASGTGGGRSYTWIWILVILIILVALAIIFRTKLKIFLSKLKGKFKKGPSKRRPGFPPSRPGPRPGPRMMPRRPMGRRPMARRPGPIRRALSKTDKELDDTFKKLREMSK
jgi:hypothetical protein